jgi:hypothetical protein
VEGRKGKRASQFRREGKVVDQDMVLERAKESRQERSGAAQEPKERAKGRAGTASEQRHNPFQRGKEMKAGLARRIFNLVVYSGVVANQGPGHASKRDSAPPGGSYVERLLQGTKPVDKQHWVTGGTAQSYSVAEIVSKSNEIIWPLILGT